MILLYTYSQSSEAYIAKGMLESHGIAAEVIDDGLASIYPTPNAGYSGYQLYVVNDAQAEEAVGLLREHGDV